MSEGVDAMIARARALDPGLDPQAAVCAWRRVLDRDPDSVEAHRALARRLAALGRLEEALTHLQRVVELAPGFAKAWTALARVLQRLGDGTGAAAAWTRALALGADQTEAHEQLMRLALALPALRRPAPAVGQVLVAGPGRHFADTAPRLVVADGEHPPPDLHPRLIVIPAYSVFELPGRLERARAWPREIWSRVREGTGAVVLDASCEAMPLMHGSVRDMHRFAADLSLPPDRVVYLTQHRPYGAQYARFCREAGLEPAMRVLIHDYFVRIGVREHEARGGETFERRLAAFRARPRTRERRFVSLNLTPRPPKVAFLLRVLEDGLWSEGFISFGGFARQSGKRTPEELKSDMGCDKHFGPMVRARAARIAELEAMGQVLLGSGGSRTPAGAPKLSEDAALAEYDRSWFTVVTETEMRRRPSRITEKPLKALANFHPFLVLGNPGALRMLRDLGFETYGELASEAYDEESSPVRRFEMVYGQFLRLCALAEDDLARLDAAVSEKVVFNARRLLTELPALMRDVMDPLLLRLILEPAGAWDLEPPAVRAADEEP